MTGKPFTEAVDRMLAEEQHRRNRHPAESVTDDHVTPSPRALRDQLLSLDDLGRLPAADPLVAGLLYRNTLAQLAGPPGSYKSFVAVGLACAVAAGQSWEGHNVPRRQRVVYVAAEGASGLRARILAWCELSNVAPSTLDGWLYVLPVPIQLGVTTHVDAAATLVRDFDVGLVILDTRARCTLDLEENSATEQGKAIAAADRIREAGGCTVLAVHHSGRNGTAPRGSTAWDGAVWSDLRLRSDYLAATIHAEKHKDAPSGMDFHYRLVPHTVSSNAMPGTSESARKALVVVSGDGEKTGEILTAHENSVRELCEKSCGLEGLTRTQIVDLAVEAGIAKSSAYRAVNTLVKHGQLRNVGTEKRVRYVYSGAQIPLGDSA